jgi:outer membrane protein assembly factor BamB
MPPSTDKLIFIGIKGAVLALDRATGKESWRRQLKGSDFVNLLLEGPHLFASARGELFCLDPDTGKVLWNNPLKGLGWGLVTFATPSAAPLAEHLRRQAAAASAGAAGAGH